MENSMEILQKTKNRSSNPTPGHISRQNYNSKRYMHCCVNSSPIHNNHDMHGNNLSSGQFTRSVMSDSLRPHELQHTRPPCPPPIPRVHPNPCPWSQWCHPTILCSVVPFSSCPQSFPASQSFPMSQFFTWSGQSIGVSASTSIPPMNTQDWPLLGWTGLISLQSKELSRVFSNTTVEKHQFFGAQLSL